MNWKTSSLDEKTQSVTMEREVETAQGGKPSRREAGGLIPKDGAEFLGCWRTRWRTETLRQGQKKRNSMEELQIWLSKLSLLKGLTRTPAQ